MQKKNTTTLSFGKSRRSAENTEKPAPNAEKLTVQNTHSPAYPALIVSAVITASFFLGTLSGAGLRTDGARAESALNEAVPTMSYAVAAVSAEENSGAESETDSDYTRETLRPSVRDTSGEPFGYLGGEWNLWEYIGDVMADLLIG